MMKVVWGVFEFAVPMVFYDKEQNSNLKRILLILFKLFAFILIVEQGGLVMFKKLLLIVCGWNLLLSAAQAQEVIQVRTIVYYLNPGYNSYISKKMERMSKEALAENFPTNLERGALEFKVVNTSLPENKYFMKHYKIGIGEHRIIFSKLYNFKEVDVLNLDKVWPLSKDENAFKEYITEQVREFVPKPIPQDKIAAK